MLDANIPIDSPAELTSINPNICTSTTLMFGVPKCITIKKYINDIINVIIITASAANNFPNTTLDIFTGDVNSICSVPAFLSSANILIVNIGTIIISPYSAV